MKRLAIPVLFLVSALLLSSCSLHLGLGSLLGGKSGSPSAAKSVKVAKTPSTPSNPDAVTIAAAKYRPKNLTVKVGTTVTWTNNDTKSESVTSDTPGVFDSGSLSPGATWSFTFSNAGTFPYHSVDSSTTYGSVIVTP